MNKQLAASAILAVLGFSCVGYVVHKSDKGAFYTIVSEIMMAIGKEPTRAERETIQKKWEAYQAHLIQARKEALARREAEYNSEIETLKRKLLEKKINDVEAYEHIKVKNAIRQIDKDSE